MAGERSQTATVREPARQTPVVHECDVCVVGGSCTGVFAAVAAARLGARVAVVENNGLFGGTATAGLVNIWHSLRDTTGERQIIAGLTAETLDRLKQRGAMLDEKTHYYVHPHQLAIELDELITEAGVRPFLHARFVAPVMEGGRLAAAVIEDKTGRRAIRATVFVDATGDGDVIARCGLPTRMLDDLQSPSVVAILQGMDEVRRQNPGFDLARAAFDTRFPEALPPGSAFWYAPVPGAFDMRVVAGTRVTGANCADADELTAAEMEGRRQVRRILDLVRRHFAGGERLALGALSSHIGVRETRHADCLHTLTENELLYGERFPDAIANGTYRVDVHHSTKPGLTFRFLDGREVYSVPGRPKVTGRWRPEGEECATFYQIPYRSLTPRGSVNVLAAGRLIDADRGAYGAIRVMVNCNQTGEAAGAAAALALNRGGRVADVDPALLRRTLADRGAVVI